MIGIKDCECQLLGAWLLDYHREHIKDFEYFSVYVDIFKAIKESTKIDMVTVANKAKCSVTEIAEITSQYMPSLYTSSYKFVKKHQIQMRLESLKNSPDDIVTQIDQLHKEIEKLNMTEIRKPTDLSDNYSKEIENRLLEDKTIKWTLPKIDYITGGIHKAELTVIAARPSIGKEQPLYSKILTPHGWTIMGNINVGDQVIGSDGKPCNVTGIFPQGEKDIYRVYFSDGTTTDCGLEHLWETQTRNERKGHKPPQVRTTSEIIKTLTVNKDNRLNHSVRYVEPVEFPKKPLGIHPYVLGVLIGDGGFTKGGSLGLTNSETDVISKVQVLLPDTEYLKEAAEHGYYTLIRKQRNNQRTETIIELEKMGLLGLKSESKFIPWNYMYSCVEDRLELLRGLLDTDGFLYQRTTFEYSTSSPMLAENVRELILSLGGRCSILKRKGKYRRNGEIIEARENYRLFLRFANGIVPISSQKHLRKYSDKTRNDKKYIKNIVKIGRFEAQCIMVDSQDHLYVTDDYILTHNTALALQVAFKASLQNNKVLFFPLEMRAAELTERLVCTDTDIIHEHLKTPGKMDSKEYEKLQGWLESFKRTGKDLRVIENVRALSEIERYIAYYKPDLVVIDQLSKLKEYMHFKSIREQFSYMTNKCKEITMKYGVPIILLAQLNRTADDKKVPTLGDLKESGSIEEDADNVIMIHQLGDMDSNFTTPIQIIVRKQRNGQRDVIIDAKYFNKKFTFIEVM